jgi:succinoglycan biosynthesis transport protein ExoP
MRKPRLNAVFDLTNTWGLSNLLLERNPIEEYPLNLLVQETKVPNLYVLPSGPEAASISNLLFSPRLRELVTRFQREFDTVLIDTPPMLEISDARILGRLADGVIMVFFANHTTRDTALAAVQRFREDGTPIFELLFDFGKGFVGDRDFTAKTVRPNIAESVFSAFLPNFGSKVLVGQQF